SPVQVMSTALLLSVLTLATQFVHPLIDPWPAGDYEFRSAAPQWIGENLGMAALLAQTAILAGTGLLLNSGFKLRPGSLTFVFTMNGIPVCIAKGDFPLLSVSVLS